jgi:hypothetical protein
MTLSGTIDPAAIGFLVNSATVSAPSGVSDPNSGNNSATDIDSLACTIDVRRSLDGALLSAATAIRAQNSVFRSAPSDRPNVKVYRRAARP